MPDSTSVWMLWRNVENIDAERESMTHFYLFPVAEDDLERRSSIGTSDCESALAPMVLFIF